MEIEKWWKSWRESMSCARREPIARVRGDLEILVVPESTGEIFKGFFRDAYMAVARTEHAYVECSL